MEARPRADVAEARLVYDYLQKDSATTSTDKRMAIEGALLGDRQETQCPREVD